MKIAGTGYGYENVASKSELKQDKKVFDEAQKKVRKAEVRNADWGLYAAQNCLARDLVNASADEMGLIMDKMDFIQKHMNENMQVDSQIYQDKTDANVKRTQARTDMIKTTTDSAIDIADKATGIIGNASVGKVLDIAA